MKRILALVLCTLMTVALLAGCGSKKNDDTNNDKTWVVATDTTFRPFEYTDKDGNFVGIDVDIMAAVAADQGFKYELKSLGWDAAIAACKSKQANAMIAGASIKQDRIDSGWIFSDGYYTATQCMTVRTDSDIKGFGDLSGKAVAVKTGTMGATYAESLKDQYGFTTQAGEIAVITEAIRSGAVKGCITELCVAQSVSDNNPGEFQIIADNLSEEQIKAVANLNSTKLIEEVNKIIDEFTASDDYSALVVKWFG